MSIDAMKMALEALEGLRDLFYQDTIEALRTAIEAAERQEPIYQWRDKRSNSQAWIDSPQRHYDEWKSYPYYEWRTVFTTPQPAIPDGMVLVPMNRYSEIIRCLEDIAMGKGGWAWEDVLDEHKAMLSSAPEVPK